MFLNLLPICKLWHLIFFKYVKSISLKFNCIFCQELPFICAKLGKKNIDSINFKLHVLFFCILFYLNLDSNSFFTVSLQESLELK